MARYKHIDISPRFLAVDLEAQLLPGTLEHALNHLLDHEIDLAGFDERFKNDDTGASAYPPAMLLKVVLLAYSRGIVSTRAIERACREHVTFIALSGDTCPHFTTIAAFVSGLGELIGKVFQQVLRICDAQGLIGREMFAIDGVKLPSNASKERSGTRADFQHQARKMEAAVQTMLERHREADSGDTEPSQRAKDVQHIERLGRQARRIRSTMAAAASKSGKCIDELLDVCRATIPARRLGTAAEFGVACAILCSAQAGYITGQNWLLDGGGYPGTF